MICRARTSKRPKTPLFQWRHDSGQTQEELGQQLGLTRVQLAEFETGQRSLAGEGILIIRWAEHCLIEPADKEVQAVLYETGNAPFIPDPNCPSCEEAINRCAVDLFDEHQYHQSLTRSPQQGRQTYLVQSLIPIRLHPYTSVTHSSSEWGSCTHGANTFSKEPGDARRHRLEI